MRKWLIILVSVFSLFAQEDWKSFSQDDKQAFLNEKEANTKALKTINKEFDSYQKLSDTEFKSFKKKLGKFWDQPKISTKKVWVEYSKDLKQRKVVNFDNNTITIDIHEKNSVEAKKAIAKALIDTVTKNMKEAYRDDILAQNIEKKLPKAKHSLITTDPILAPTIFKTPPSTKELVNYAMKEIKKNKLKKKRSKIPKLGHYSVTIKMPNDAMQKRSRQYLSKVKKEAHKFKVPWEVVMAVIHTESAFNPMARSHIPAFGLMQIVPRSAGRDVYSFLYNKRKILSPSYLHNVNNNIKIGTAYLHILYYKYLKPIQNPQSRLSCAIASYNTGAGNVSRTFSGTTSPYKAAKKINKMSSKNVYNYMIKHLKYHETRNYLKNVSSRAQHYKKLYK